MKGGRGGWCNNNESNKRRPIFPAVICASVKTVNVLLCVCVCVCMFPLSFQMSQNDSLCIINYPLTVQQSFVCVCVCVCYLKPE